MKFHLLVVAALLGLDHQVNAWAPSLSSVATRTAPKISRRHRYSSSLFELYVKADVEEQKVVDDKTLAAFQEPKTQILGQPIPYSELTIGVLKETFKGENRVSQTPDSIRTLVKAGITVLVQSGGK
jgi:NAD(P) transhydrogenase